MFKQKPQQPSTTPDHTRNLRDPQFYRFGHLRSLGLQGDLSALAYDPLLGLLAAGTSTGLVHLSGAPAFTCTIPLYPHGYASSSAQARVETSAGVKLLAFHPGERLVVIDTRNTVHVFALAPGKMDDAKGLPRKTLTLALYGDAVYMDQPTPATAHVAVTFRDGTVVWVDMERGCVAPYK
jgi:syntaxin-binding protein 5